MKMLLCTTACLMVAVPAFAGQITFGPSVQDVTFTATATGLTVTAPQLDMQAIDTTNALLGGAWLLGLDFTTGPEVGGIFAANPNVGTFKYINPDGDTLIEDVSATFVQDDTTQPKVFGTGVTTSISGDAAFFAAFGPVGTADKWDFITNGLGTTLTALTGSASATISAGEKISTSSPVPEPASLLLLAGGMFGLAWLNRRRQNG